MSGNNPEVKALTPEVRRLRASGPILILAVLFVGGAFLTWYFSWFGRNLSDSDISQYLVDEKHPRRVQHALLQIQQRIERGDQTAKQWYPHVIRLASHPETEFRLTVAWLMGFDNKSQEFHQTLGQLLNDQEPIVRRNAALALVRFNDPSGRAEVTSILQPYEVHAPVEGVVGSTLSEGAQVARGTLLGRIIPPDGKTVEVRSPLLGKLERIHAPINTKVTHGQTILTINSDEESIWEALRALSLIGEPEELPLVDRFAKDPGQSDRVSDRVRQQAALTIKVIQGRASQKK